MSVARGTTTDVEVVASNFAVSALQPFLSAAVQGVGGRLDGALRASVGTQAQSAQVTGALRLSQGAFALPALGGGFHGIDADIAVAPDGSIRADHIKARGLTGSIGASAEAHFRGLRFDSATADFVVPKGEALPLSIEGERLAEFWGKVSVLARPPEAGAGLDLRIDVQKAGILVPQATARTLQELAPPEHVRFGEQRGGQFVVRPRGNASPSDGHLDSPVVIDLHVKDTEVTRGPDERALLDGHLLVRPGAQTRVTGVVHLQSGSLEVQGKRFDIESGTVTFSGDPDNPVVVLTATWNAPDGTRVYADFVGPLETGKVSLRSYPVHTKSEILSLILFGTPAGEGAPAAGGSATSGAVGLGGNFAAQDVNRALDRLTGLELTTRVDTSESTVVRPELELRVARDISLSVAHVIGVPPPGTNPDLNWGTVDWRFRRNWSLEATFGDRGSSILDFVWRHRY